MIIDAEFDAQIYACKGEPTTGDWTTIGQGGYERKRADGTPWRSLNVGLANGRNIAEVCIPKGGGWDHPESLAKP